MQSRHWITTPSGKLRARGLNLPLPGIPGPFNAITDVAGVAIGYANIVEGEGPLISGKDRCARGSQPSFPVRFPPILPPVQQASQH